MIKTISIGEKCWLKANVMTIGTLEYKNASFKKPWKVEIVELTKDEELVVVQDTNKNKYLVEIQNLEEFTKEDELKEQIKGDLESRCRVIERTHWLYKDMELVVMPVEEDCPYQFGTMVKVTNTRPMSFFPQFVEVQKEKNGKKYEIHFQNLRMLPNQMNFHELIQLNMDIVKGKISLDALSRENKKALLGILKKM